MRSSLSGFWAAISSGALAFGVVSVGCGTSPDASGSGGSTSASGGTTTSSGGSGTAGSGGSGTGGDAPPPLGEGLGAYPVEPSPITRGGTMTFTNVGAPGFWPRRLERAAGDSACDYKDGTDTWGGHCCMKEQHTSSTTLAPFDEEMTLIMKAIRLRQLAIYQPLESEGDYRLVSAWDARSGTGRNLTVTRGDETTTSFDGDLTANDCVTYFAQDRAFDCGDGRDYFCPDDPGMLRLGYAGSKLIVFLGSMDFDDANVAKCDGAGAGHPGPWVAFVASELVRDGARKWNGLCNCYSKTGSVGDGCGEINLFEVVLDGNEYSNREFMSTGVRSFQAGHVGGNVCGAGCDRNDYADDVEVIDACAETAFDVGPTLEMGGIATGCPVWRRPIGDRYFVISLDEKSRSIQVSVVHPENVPDELAPFLPELPEAIGRSVIDDFAALRLPE